jgi:alpha-acetolactate decarboxylase
MKVLTTPTTAKTLALGFGAFRTFDGEVTTLEGIVLERSEASIAAEAARAGVTNEYGELKEEMRMLRSVSKSLAAWEVGDKVVCSTSGKQGAITIPLSGRFPSFRSAMSARSTTPQPRATS